MGYRKATPGCNGLNFLIQLFLRKGYHVKAINTINTSSTKKMLRQIIFKFCCQTNLQRFKKTEIIIKILLTGKNLEQSLFFDILEFKRLFKSIGNKNYKTSADFFLNNEYRILFFSSKNNFMISH